MAIGDVTRVCVPVLWYWEHALGLPVWRFDGEAQAMGLDPWMRLDDHIDRMSDLRGFFIGSDVATDDYPVWVQRRDLVRNGLNKALPGDTAELVP